MSKRKYRLGDIAPASTAEPEFISNGQDVWLLNLDKIEPHTGQLIAEEKVNFSDVGSSTAWFDEGNVLYSKLRPYLNKVFVPKKKGIATTELVPLRPDQNIVTREYLAYYLRSDGFLNWVNAQIDGAKMPRVSMKIFWNHEIELSSLEEQKRIVAILDKADSLRRKRQQAIQLADDFLRTTFLDMFGDPVTNPKGWPVGTIRDLVESANYGTSDKADEHKGKFPILRMNNITYAGRWDLSSLKYIDLDPKAEDKYLARNGDLLFNRTNSKELVGKAAIFESELPMAVAGYLIRVRLNKFGNPYYVSAYLNSGHGKATLQSMCKSIVGMANINAQEMQSIGIMLPPKEIQDRYAEIVSKVRRAERLQLESENGVLSAASALTASLM